MKNSIKISVIICTHDRLKLLKLCIKSLLNQDVDPLSFEIIIINNSLNDLSIDMLEISNPRNILISILQEKRIGLSIARNSGWKNSLGYWVAYIDDDAKAEKNWLKRATFFIDTFSYDCFGGIYIPWYENEKPNWLPESYGSKPILRPNAGLIREGYNWGSNIFFRKAVLTELGGFPENLGMKGKKIGYAEETWVQKMIRELGHQIGFDPELKIYHLVPERKLTLSWHIKSAFAEGRDQREIYPAHYTFNSLMKESIRHLFITPFGAFIKLLTKKEYTWRHFIFNTIPKAMSVVGRYFSI